MDERDLSSLLDKLKRLPEDRRAMLVVRSDPFGDIIEDDTRRVHGHVQRIERGREWSRVAYGICRAAKGCAASEADLRAAGYLNEVAAHG